MNQSLVAIGCIELEFRTRLAKSSLVLRCCEDRYVEDFTYIPLLATSQ